jgi:hypothetical protein
VISGSRPAFVATLCCLCGLCFAGCGRKGPPLAPIVFLPTPVGEFAAKRAGEDIVLRFTVPSANTDRSSPADLDRVEVYAHTGPLPAPTDFVRYGTLIATIKVKPPPEPADPDAPAALEGATAPDKQPATDLVEQGWAMSVTEPVTPALLEPGALPAVGKAVAPVAEVLETPETVNLPVPIRRYYAAVPVSRSRNRRSTFTAPVGVPMATPPSPPDGVKASYTESSITLTWNPMPGDRPPGSATEVVTLETPGTVNAPDMTVETDGTVNLSEEIPTPSEIAPPAAGAAVPAAIATAPPAPPAPLFGYNVYQADPESSAAAAASAAPTVTVGRPVLPLNAAMLTSQTFTDALVEFGPRRCYVVRRVEMVSGIAIESPAAASVCVTPLDTFPPAAPKQLVSVSDDKGVNLIWEANTERDLAGYLVLRGEAPGDMMAPLMSEPIRETSFRDTTVQPGHAYVYAVVAVDNATPPNRSEESNRQTEVIR